MCFFHITISILFLLISEGDSIEKSPVSETHSDSSLLQLNVTLEESKNAARKVLQQLDAHQARSECPRVLLNLTTLLKQRGVLYLATFDICVSNEVCQGKKECAKYCNVTSEKYKGFSGCETCNIDANEKPREETFVIIKSSCRDIGHPTTTTTTTTTAGTGTTSTTTTTITTTTTESTMMEKYALSSTSTTTEDSNAPQICVDLDSLNKDKLNP